MTDQPEKPIVIELDEDTVPSPADAPPVADMPAPTGQAMQTLATIAARPRSALMGWFWRLLLAVILFFAGVALWEFVTNLLVQNPILGMVAAGLLSVFLIVCLAICLRELAALSRLKRMDRFQGEAAALRASDDLKGARDFARKLVGFYRGRSDVSWGSAGLPATIEEAFDVDTVFLAVEDQMLVPLDNAASREIEASARQVATVTALVPLAFADVIAALTANLRMIRRIAQIYGGRSGTLGSWRLTRAVIAHLVATGAVAVGDDLLGSLGGGHILGKISRRFGEGLVNGALTARVGVAAMEVCRPLPFSASRRPKVSSLVGRALTGLFEKDAT